MNSAYDTYLEDRVLSASPVELVCLLYQGAIDAVRDARRLLAEGDIAGRSKAISKACGIVLELSVSLDRESGGEISSQLSRLYGYMHRRLVEANVRQADAPLEEVLRLLSIVSRAWERVKGGQRAESGQPARSPYARAAETDSEPVEAGWNF